MEECQYHPGNSAGTFCDECWNEYNDMLCEQETEAWRERGQ